MIHGGHPIQPRAARGLFVFSHWQQSIKPWYGSCNLDQYEHLAALYCKVGVTRFGA